MNAPPRNPLLKMSEATGKRLYVIIALFTLGLLASSGVDFCFAQTQNLRIDPEHGSLILPEAPLSKMEKPLTTPPDTHNNSTSAPLPMPSSAAFGKQVIINIPARRLHYFENNRLVKTYPVGVGRVGFPTPLGQFQVIRKVIDPGWENPYLEAGQVRILPGKNNPLGTRWIGFKNDGRGEYGIHGTDDPPSVGQFSSHGCVRMLVSDAEELFQKVEVGTPVRVTYEPVVFSTHQNRLFMTVYPDTFKKGRPTYTVLKQQIQKRYPKATINNQALINALKFSSQKPHVIGILPTPTNTSQAFPNQPPQPNSSASNNQ